MVDRVSALVCVAAVLAFPSGANGQVTKLLRRVNAISTTSLTDDTLRDAVTAWCDDPGSAIGVYGNISDWDTSEVTDMSYLFSQYRDASYTNGYCSTFDKFNEDISKWNTSSVTTMSNMFQYAASFNGDVSAWDVSSVTDLSGMFSLTTSFKGGILAWDVSSVTNLFGMFYYANGFDGDISSWDVSSVTIMSYMFFNARSFNGDVSPWNVSLVTAMDYMFAEARQFGQHICWDIPPATNTYYIFLDTVGACIEKTCGSVSDSTLYC